MVTSVPRKHLDTLATRRKTSRRGHFCRFHSGIFLLIVCVRTNSLEESQNMRTENTHTFGKQIFYYLEFIAKIKITF